MDLIMFLINHRNLLFNIIINIELTVNRYSYSDLKIYIYVSFFYVIFYDC